MNQTFKLAMGDVLTVVPEIPTSYDDFIARLHEMRVYADQHPLNHSDLCKLAEAAKETDPAYEEHGSFAAVRGRGAIELLKDYLRCFAFAEPAEAAVEVVIYRIRLDYPKRCPSDLLGDSFLYLSISRSPNIQPVNEVLVDTIVSAMMEDGDSCRRAAAPALSDVKEVLFLIAPHETVAAIIRHKD